MQAPGAPNRIPTPGGPGAWRAKLGEAWPLLLVGGGCEAFGAVLAIGRNARLIDHLSPTFLFLAVGLIGIAGGVASYWVGPQPNGSGPSPTLRPTPGPAPRRESVGSSQVMARIPISPVRSGPVAGTPSRPEPSRRSPMDWGPGGASEIPRSLVLDPALIRRPAWAKGRLLRLSDDGALTVYSLDDALRELDAVTHAVRSRRTSQLPATGSPPGDPPESPPGGN